MSSMFSRHGVVGLATFFLINTVQAKPEQLPSVCVSLISSTYPTWKTLTPHADVLTWASAHKFNPVVATGDFDGNGQKDWATLGSDGKNSKVILCMSVGNMKKIVVAEDGGCSDYIDSYRAKSSVLNYDTGKQEVLRRDVVATSCFEKSGRVFILERGQFRVFFNSD